MSDENNVNGSDIPLSKPSIFEIVAHESVAAVFKPAFHYVFKILVQRYPDKLGVILKYADEIYMLCELAVQRHYLTHYTASLSENFYYLKRVDISDGNYGRRLSQKLHNLSLLSLVFLPYIKAKVEKYFENIRDKTIREENEDSSGQGKLMKIFLKVYPYIHFALQSPSAIYQLGYILDLLNYHSPFFHALRIQLVRASSQDLLGLSSDGIFTSKSFYEKMLSLPGLFIDKIIKFIAVIMPAVIFFLQFVEWWYSADHEMTASVTKLPIPPPPQAPKALENGCGLPPHPLQCPLCEKLHWNMAALVSSGFVFCYPCIHQYITQHGVCPVTHIPSSLDQILRIYSLQDS